MERVFVQMFGLDQAEDINHCKHTSSFLIRHMRPALPTFCRMIRVRKSASSVNVTLQVPLMHQDTTGVISHSLITLSVPEVSNHPLVASKCT